MIKSVTIFLLLLFPECPICREPFNPDTLIENVFIRKNAASSDNGEGKEQKCTGCETNPATSYCLQCDDWLCADCVNAHKRVRMTKDHQLTSLEEAVANKGMHVCHCCISQLPWYNSTGWLGRKHQVTYLHFPAEHSGHPVYAVHTCTLII